MCVVALCTCAFGCGGDDSTVDACAGPVPGDYFPTLDGSRYVYNHTPASGASWVGDATIATVEYQGMEAIEVVDGGDPSGERTVSIWVRDDAADNPGAVRRIHKDVDVGGTAVMAVDYDPGFLRFDHAWLERAEGESFELSYTRTETAADGTVKEDLRTHQYTVEALHEPLTIGNCPYDTVRVRRIRVGFGGDESKVFWFAPGVGKVQERNLDTGSLEQLQQVFFGG